jgi:hypothetical protein
MRRQKQRIEKHEPEVYRLVLRLPRDIIYHLKARAAAERTSVSALVAEWVESWKDVKRK